MTLLGYIHLPTLSARLELVLPGTPQKWCYLNRTRNAVRVLLLTATALLQIQLGHFVSSFSLSIEGFVISFIAGESLESIVDVATVPGGP
ncbi:MAG TPA: hypothetical protein VH186_01415 [Chloroflexia bacterium]|nr:hypothetical protein [Chloroflexia bacterium]